MPLQINKFRRSSTLVSMLVALAKIDDVALAFTCDSARSGALSRFLDGDLSSLFNFGNKCRAKSMPCRYISGFRVFLRLCEEDVAGAYQHGKRNFFAERLMKNTWHRVCLRHSYCCVFWRRRRDRNCRKCAHHIIRLRFK